MFANQSKQIYRPSAIANESEACDSRDYNVERSLYAATNSSVLTAN